MLFEVICVERKKVVGVGTETKWVERVLTSVQLICAESEEQAKIAAVRSIEGVAGTKGVESEDLQVYARPFVRR